jgi:hypothetical protein
MLGVALDVSAASQYKILSECDPSSEVRALIAKDAPLAVHFAIASATTCYSVTATVDGKPVRGYVLDPGLDGVLAFEKAVSQARQNLIEAPQVLPPPVAPATDSVAGPTDTKKSPDAPEPVTPKEAPKPKAKIEDPSH